MAGKQRTYTQEQIDKAASILSNLPEKPAAERPKTTAETLESLKPIIKEATAKGYTLDEIAQLLKNAEITVSLSTIKAAVKVAKKSSQKSKLV